ncbi:MAG: aminotransferase class I/II-fold pyridoxal phosphate-dependent enzyme, partial [Proteobacteria bacterium]|nr:aminotransferase class I/II-fold pyridoxal phosphate-dependent enzyme [Pseudomonadota bacterium]
MNPERDHGGGLDAAINQYGGTRRDWLDLSTGINPNPYPIPDIPLHYWHVLPDECPQKNLLDAARAFWNVPDGAEIIPASGVSAIIALLPNLVQEKHVSILGPTYNEFAASFTGQNWSLHKRAPVQVRVHPNNPDGQLFARADIEKHHDKLTIIDESFCDVCLESSLIDLAQRPNHIILKGTGKFWGLAGLRLGFAITTANLAYKITQQLGPWNISGPAQFIGEKALSDTKWVDQTRTGLALMTKQLKAVLVQNGITVIGGTDLFVLAETSSAKTLHNHL